MIRRKDSSRAAALRSYTVQMVSGRLPRLDRQVIADRLSYGSFVSLEHKILYVETPKAACTTVKEFLRELCGAPPIKLQIGPLWETRRDMFIHVRANVPLPSLLDLDQETQRRVLTAPDFLRFSIVRNPYDRLVSAWRNKILLCEPGYEYVYRRIMGDVPPVHDKKTLSFEQFLEFVEGEMDLGICNPHWRRQVDLLLYPAIPYTHIGQLERFQDTVALIKQHASRGPPVRFAKSNSAGAGGGHSPIDDDMAVRIQQLYAADFEAFGYSKESWRRTPTAAGENDHVPQARFLDEVIERNLVISRLYEEYALLEARYRRRYVLPLIWARNKLVAWRKALRRQWPHPRD